MENKTEFNCFLIYSFKTNVFFFLNENISKIVSLKIFSLYEYISISYIKENISATIIKKYIKTIDINNAS